MRPCNRPVALSFLFAVLVGCASTKVTQETPMAKTAVARPDRIWVYDFAATPGDVPADSAIGGKVGAAGTAPTAEQVETGRRLGALIAQNLVASIQAMGLPAARAGSGSAPQVGDGVIRGYLVSVESGSAGKRFIIGFGSGKAELDTVVEGYVMTPRGLHKLGSGTLSASGAKTPGVVVPSAVAIASGSPVGLIVVGGAKLYGEATGRTGLDGRAKSTADEIAGQLKIRFQDRGWISEG
jgi:hypothetical protein